MGKGERVRKGTSKIFKKQTLRPLNSHIYAPILPTFWKENQICKLFKLSVALRLRREGSETSPAVKLNKWK